MECDKQFFGIMFEIARNRFEKRIYNFYLNNTWVVARYIRAFFCELTYTIIINILNIIYIFLTLASPVCNEM